MQNFVSIHNLYFYFIYLVIFFPQRLFPHTSDLVSIKEQRTPLKSSK